MGYWKEIESKMNGDCMECTSHYINQSGYPIVYRNDRHWILSRYIYTQRYGIIPDGKIIRHTCDNTTCINIDHLLIGTHQDNANDKISRNRQPRGINASCVKLTEKEVIEIRSLKNNFSPNALAKKYNVSQRNIRTILKGETWKHLL